MAGLFSRFRSKKSSSRAFCSAVIVAAGSGERMNGINKLFAEIEGKPVLAHTLLSFEKSEYIDEIIVVAREEEIGNISELTKSFAITKVKKVIRGGDKRRDSVYIGLMEVSEDSQLVAIQDGARPLVSEKVIESAVLAATESGAAAPAVPVKDTIKVVKSGEIAETPDRATLFAVQTPQVFKNDIIKVALTEAIQAGVELTDDCMAVERLGIAIKITEGDYNNIKITTPADLVIAEAIMRERNCAG